MKKDFVIYTAIFGGYDELKDPISPSPLCDYICFTDDQRLTSKVWQVQYVGTGSESKSFWNRKYKMLPHRYLANYSRSLYVDGNIQLAGDSLRSVAAYGSNIKVAIPPHPERSCSYDEVETCLGMGLITVADAQRWMHIYSKAGFPRNQGLFENNVIFRVHHETDVINLMEAWWKEYWVNAGRDQLSLTFLAWKQGLVIHPMKYGPRVSRKYFRIALHIPGRQCGPVLRIVRLVELKKHLNVFYAVAHKAFGALVGFRLWFRGKLRFLR